MNDTLSWAIEIDPTPSLRAGNQTRA